MNQMLVRFLLKDSHYVETVLPYNQAKELVESHLHGKLKGLIGGEDLAGFWSLDTENIQGIRTSPFNPQQPSQQGLVYPNISGGRN